MPLDKFVLILVLVVVAAGLTVWLGAFLIGATQMPAAAGLVAVPVLLIVYVVWRVIADRINSAEDDHYDNIDR